MKLLNSTHQLDASPTVILVASTPKKTQIRMSAENSTCMLMLAGHKSKSDWSEGCY